MFLGIKLAMFFTLILGFCTSPMVQQKVDKKSDNKTGTLVLDPSVSPHKEIDEIYHRFNEGYKKLDPAIVANLYSESASYLQPNSDIQTGRASILKNFTEFFDDVKSNKRKIEIAFRIVKRDVENNLAYDVGIYTLTSFNEKGDSNSSNGKFVVAAKRESDGVWRFQVDIYNDFPNIKPLSQ